MQALHRLSLTTAPVEICGTQDNRLSVATSFFYESSDSRLFLITNWHVVTGRKPSKSSHSKTGVVPTRLKIKIHEKQENVDGKATINVRNVSEFSIEINSEDGDEPKWLEHPVHKQKADVVAFDLSNYLEFRKTYEFQVVNKWEEYHKDYEPQVMDDVFVIGYPWGISSTVKQGGGLPVYKKGCIASDPILNFGQRPCILIDCRTTEAMSGSPVIASRSGIFMPDGKMSGNTVFGTVSMFLGVYSGRLPSKDYVEDHKGEISEIGKVWKASILDDITQWGISGTPLSALAE